MDRKFYLPTLDGWRAVAIILVMIYHGTWLHFSPDGASYNPQLWPLLKQGGFGVQVFFALSGYLICSRILYEIKFFGKFSLSDFYIKRSFRILPPFYGFILVASLLLWVNGNTIQTNYYLYALTFSQIYMTEHFWYFSHFWSLCVEEYFYILLSSIFYFFPTKKIIFILGTCFLFIGFWKYYSFHHQSDPGIEYASYILKPFSEMAYMLAGCGFAFMATLDLKLNSKLTLILFLLFLPLIFINFPLKYGLFPIMTAGLIYLTSQFSHPLTNWFLQNPLMNFIGKISYSLYLYQQLFFVDKTQNLFLNSKNLQSFPLNINLIFALAIASHYLIEKPILKWSKKLTKHHF